MNRKIFRLVLLFCVLLATLFASSAIYAQDEDLPNPGITPDSPFYFFDKIGKNLRMAFAFGNEAKASLSLKYAEERLAEARLMTSENKTEYLERITEDYDRFMARVQEKLEKTKQKGHSDNISERVALAINKHFNILARVKAQVPEKAQEAIAHAENVSMNGQINALRALGKDKPARALEICDNVTARNLERVRVRVRATDNVTSDNATSYLDFAERIAALEDEIIDFAEETGTDVTAILERLAHSTANRLATLSGVYEKAPESARPGLENAIENSVRKYERTLEKLQNKNVATTENTTTLQALPAKIKEKLQNRISNKEQNTMDNGDNVSGQLRNEEENQKQNRERGNSGKNR